MALDFYAASFRVFDNCGNPVKHRDSSPNGDLALLLIGSNSSSYPKMLRKLTFDPANPPILGELKDLRSIDPTDQLRAIGSGIYSSNRSSFFAIATDVANQYRGCLTAIGGLGYMIIHCTAKEGEKFHEDRPLSETAVHPVGSVRPLSRP